MNRLILPKKYQGQAPAAVTKVDAMAESVGDIYMKHLDDLLKECWKDLNGGLLPTVKNLKKHARTKTHTDGRIFYWKNQPMLYVSHPSIKVRPDGKMDIDIVHKKLYAAEKPEPVKATN